MWIKCLHAHHTAHTHTHIAFNFPSTAKFCSGNHQIKSKYEERFIHESRPAMYWYAVECFSFISVYVFFSVRVFFSFSVRRMVSSIVRCSPWFRLTLASYGMIAFNFNALFVLFFIRSTLKHARHVWVCVLVRIRFRMKKTTTTTTAAWKAMNRVEKETMRSLFLLLLVSIPTKATTTHSKWIWRDQRIHRKFSRAYTRI